MDNVTATQEPDAPAASALELPQLPDFSDRISDAEANAMYAAAYNLSRLGRHEQAATMLSLLTLYRPDDARTAYALGVCLRKMGQYKEAIRAFADAMELRHDDFEPAFQLIECMALLGRRNEIWDLLRLIEEVSRHEGKTDWADRAKTLMELLQVPVQ